MAIIISQIKTTLDEPKDNAVAKALSLLRLSRAETASAKLYKSSVDARRDICFVNSVYIAMKDPAKERRLAEKHQNVRLYEPGELSFTRGKERLRGDVYVAGFGPAGMFCALTLCEFGYRPVVLERGAEFIHRLEEKAYQLGRGGKAPTALTREFVSGGNSFTLGRVDPTYSLGVEPADLNELFPEYVSQPMKNGLRYFDRRIPGFSDSDSVLTAIETRSSSPVRLPRNEAGSAECADNLFPCGEGCGYAGGIMSAAVDGIKTAVRIMERFAPSQAE